MATFKGVEFSEALPTKEFTCLDLGILDRPWLFLASAKKAGCPALGLPRTTEPTRNTLLKAANLGTRKNMACRNRFPKPNFLLFSDPVCSPGPETRLSVAESSRPSVDPCP